MLVSGLFLKAGGQHISHFVNFVGIVGRTINHSFRLSITIYLSVY